MNAEISRTYTGSRALQLINGIERIVANLSHLFSMILVLIIAGTLHPKPKTIGIKLLPESPVFVIYRSMITAALAIYPVPSRKAIPIKSRKTFGVKTSTPPVPAIIPSTMTDRSSESEPSGHRELTDVEIYPKRDSIHPIIGSPRVNTIWNRTYIITKNIGIAVNLLMNIESSSAVRGLFFISSVLTQTEAIPVIIL